jgi:hypothetical protein
LNYNFEWDLGKAKTNFAKHRISFQRASNIFLDPFALSIFDDEHSIDEDRWLTLGKDSNGILIVVSHTYRKIDFNTCTIRIISARKATRKERRQYEE